MAFKGREKKTSDASNKSGFNKDYVWMHADFLKDLRLIEREISIAAM